MRPLRPAVIAAMAFAGANVVQNGGGAPGGGDGPTTPGQISADARVSVTSEIAS